MPSLTIIFLLFILLITAFASAQDPTYSFSFPHDAYLNSSSLDLSNATVSDGILTLDGNTSTAAALYKNPISFVDSNGNSNLSFSSSFIFSSNSTLYGSGSLYFIISSTLPSADNSSSTKLFAVAFTLGYPDEAPQPLAFAVSFLVRANDSLYQLNDAPALNQSYQQPCSADSHVNPLYEYQVSVEYNASTNQFSAAFSACAFKDFQAVYNINQDLSFLNNSMFVGFLAGNGGVYNISQWNFTSIPTFSDTSTLAMPPSNSSVNRGTADVLPGGSSTSRKLGYVVGLSMMGLAIGALILVVGACWFWRKPKRADRLGASFGTDPAIAMATTDFRPLNPMSGDGSAASEGAGTAGWLKPVAAR